MKKQEFINVIKEIAKVNGIELVKNPMMVNGEEMYSFKEKDPWTGCEFAEITEDSNSYITKGRIYPIQDMALLNFRIRNDKGEDGGIIFKASAKPSTEQAYIEQLKKEALERFGEIKKSQQFIDCFGCAKTVKTSYEEDYLYFKDSDQFFAYNICIYQQGKWATKLPERVKVEVVGSTLYATQMDDKQEIEIRFESSKPINKSKSEISEFLANELENYLNNKQNETETRD